VAWSPDGTRLATASNDPRMRIWNIATGKTTTTHTGHTDGVSSVAWSPDGTCLATASWNKTVRICDPATGQTLTTLIGHKRGVTAVAWSPDGTHLATASWDQTVRIWNPTSPQHGPWPLRLLNPRLRPIATLTGHTDRVNAVAWSLDGAHLATASDDQTVRIWDPATGKTTTTLTGHTSAVTAVAWSPDGTYLATADRHGTITLWTHGKESTSVTIQSATSLAWSTTKLAVGQNEGRPAVFELSNSSYSERTHAQPARAATIAGL